MNCYTCGEYTEDSFKIDQWHTSWKEGLNGRRYCESCFKVVAKPKEGTCWYDVAPQAGDLWVVEGPLNYPIHKISEAVEHDSLPDGFRWIEDEWQFFSDTVPMVSLYADGSVTKENH